MASHMETKWLLVTKEMYFSNFVEVLIFGWLCVLNGMIKWNNYQSFLLVLPTCIICIFRKEIVLRCQYFISLVDATGVSLQMMDNLDF